MTWQALLDDENRVVTVNHWEHEVGIPCDRDLELGSVWNGTEFLPPPPAVPQEVTAGQAQAALLQAGLLDEVEALINDPSTDRMFKIAWAKALTFRRDSYTLQTLAALVPLTEAQLDELFIAAAQIEF